MIETDSLTGLLGKSHKYTAADLDAMRQAFMRACGENPLAAETESQRLGLAKAMLRIYQRSLTQTQLVAAALRNAHLNGPKTAQPKVSVEIRELSSNHQVLFAPANGENERP